MDDPLDLINTYIVTNHNNEITAIVLNPVLQAIVLEYRDFIGDLNTLTTPDTEDLVQAINSLQTQFYGFTFEGVQVYSGTDDPNDTPPLSYNVADFYKQLDGGGNTIALFQYNGTIWKNLTEPVDVPTLQQVTEAGNTTTEEIEVKAVIVSDGTNTATLDNLKISTDTEGEVVDFNFPTDKTGEQTFAMLGDLSEQSMSFGLIVTVANTIQDDRLIGLDTTGTPFPFEIRADNANWTDFEDTFIFPSIAYDDTTGTITGFTVEVGKKVFLTIIK